MAWENIEERLKKAFRVKVAFPGGSVWLPDTHLSIDEWLTSLAETDQELRELDIRRIRFLQNRWPVEKLLELRWDDLSNKRAIWAMNAGRRAYILFSDGFDYQVIALIEPRDNTALYRAVVGKLLTNPAFVPSHPARIRNYRPDLLADIEADYFYQPEAVPAPSQSGKTPSKGGYLSKLLVGWVGKWIDLPVLGYWHHEVPDSITTSEEGNYVMKYKPSYGDKQRDEQRRRKEEELRKRQTQPDSTTKQVPGQSEGQETDQERQKKQVA